MSERRGNERCFLRHGLRVLDADTGLPVGQVVDISTDGLMVVSETPLPPGKRLRLWLEIPHWDGTSERLLLETETRWSQTDVERRFSDNGLRLTDPDEAVVARIVEVIEDLTFASER